MSDSLSNIVQVGDMKYFIGGKSTDLSYKTYSDFKNTFGSDRETEHILRKYMHSGESGPFQFNPPSDKDKLIRILKKRAQMLKSSNEFNNSTIKNKIFTQNIQMIQENLDRIMGKPVETVVIPNRKPDRKINMSHDRKIALILELSWILLHPDTVQKEVESSWANIVTNADTVHLDDVVNIMNDDTAVENELEDIKKRVNHLAIIHQMNKYLRKESKDTLDGPLNEAMLPLFDYFKTSYPIYSFFEDCIISKKPKLSSLLELLTICNKIRFKELYGIYRVKTDTLPFIKCLLKSTKTKDTLQLPNAKLSLNKSNTYSAHSSIRFFTVGTNLLIPTKNKFIRKTKLSENIYDELSFFDKQHVYIAYTKSVTDDIPMNLYDVNDVFDKIDFTKKTTLDELVDLTNIILNDAELALSVFIAFKENMST